MFESNELINVRMLMIFHMSALSIDDVILQIGYPEKTVLRCMDILLNDGTIREYPIRSKDLKVTYTADDIMTIRERFLICWYWIWNPKRLLKGK